MKPRDKMLRPVHPNRGIERAYQRRMEKLVEAMHRSVLWWVAKAYEKNPPAMQAQDSVMAMDATTAELLDRIIQRLTRYWNNKFEEAAVSAATYFADKTQKHASAAFQQALDDSGFAIDFAITPEIQDVLDATIKSNVALITNLSQQHMSEITGIVMRTVQQGGAVDELKDQLINRYHMTRRRARTIALDQNSKANAAIVRARQMQVGIKKAKWLHSHAGKHPRPTHMAMNGELFDVAKGMWDEDAEGKGKGRWVHPGELINCRCVSRSVLTGLLREKS